MKKRRFGASFNDTYHTVRDWGLICTDQDISGPEAQTKYINIPGRKTSLDVTEYAGSLTYKPRKLTLTYVKRISPMMFQPLTSAIGNAIAGKKMKIRLDTEPDCYWIGRSDVDAESNDHGCEAEITVKCEVEPYRYWGGDKWPWDSFSFVDGVVPIMKNVEVSGSKTITLPAMYRPGHPAITVKSGQGLTVSGPGINSTPLGTDPVTLPLEVYRTDKTITLTGSGTVDIVLSGETL